MDTRTKPLCELTGGELMVELKRLWLLKNITTIEYPDAFPNKELARLLEAEGLLVKSHNTALAADATIARLVLENKALKDTFQQLTNQIESLQDDCDKREAYVTKLEMQLTVAEETVDSLRTRVVMGDARIDELSSR